MNNQETNDQDYKSGNPCSLTDWSNPKVAELPEELVTSEFCITEPTKATQFMIVDKINAIIRYLRERGK